MIMNSLYDQSYVLADGNTPAMIPDADGLVSFTTLLCPGEASTPDPESISKEYDELPIIELKDLPPDQVLDPAHEYYHGAGAENVGVKPAGKKRTK